MSEDKGKCGICKIAVVLAGVGALNWGLVAIFGLDLVAALLGAIPILAKVVYILIGLAGLGLLVSLVKCCPCTKGSCSTSQGSGESK